MFSYTLSKGRSTTNISSPNSESGVGRIGRPWRGKWLVFLLLGLSKRYKDFLDTRYQYVPYIPEENF